MIEYLLPRLPIQDVCVGSGLEDRGHLLLCLAQGEGLFSV